VGGKLLVTAAVEAAGATQIFRVASGDMAISQDVIFEANRPTRELSIKEVDRDFREPKI